MIELPSGLQERLITRCPERSRDVESALGELVRRLVKSTGYQPAAPADVPWPRFVQRVWNCLEYHWDLLPRGGFGDPLAEFQHLAGAQESLLEEVALAEALELGEPQ